MYKLGSLFDGSGGFPLAGSLCGIEPKWAAEVEPYPIAVTRSRFPKMKHLGDISKINGAEIEPVDIITFGSPCQDLSVAGKRAGLKHEANGDEETTRSGLFMEAVRIIKEMRRATNGEYPTFALWENVPGAFSSKKGEDFRVVLEELIKIVEPSAVMPAVPKNGWPYADSYVGDGWSIAYRVFDAQYWGVPQRRRRIHLVLDLRGERAREVLFEREGLHRDSASGRTPWQGVAGDASDCAGADDREGGGLVCPSHAGYSDGLIGGRGLDAVAYSFDSFASNSMKSSNPHSGCRQVEVAKTLETTDPNPSKNQGGIAIVEPVPYTLKIRSGCDGGGKGALIQEDMSATLATNNDQYLFQPVTYDTRGNGDGTTVSTITGDHENLVTDYTSIVVEEDDDHMNTLTSGVRHAVGYAMQGFGDYKCSEVSSSIKSRDYKDATDLVTEATVAYSMKSIAINGVPLVEQANPICASDYKDPDIVAAPPRYIVRRLTPTECARLQGFPDKWGHPDKKNDFTDDEYRFWIGVRNTHAAINGKPQKDYSKEQMLTWYNKLHTDSAEYKMWGNGIALPPALYCMQGMREVLDEMSL